MRIFSNLFNCITEGYPALVFPTMHLMVESLNMHVITVSWDLQYLTCLAESSRAKLKAVDVTDMNSGTSVSQPGNLFYDTLKVKMIFIVLEDGTAKWCLEVVSRLPALPCSSKMEGSLRLA